MTSLVARVILPAVALAAAGGYVARPGAYQDERERYEVTELPSLGGSVSRGNSINDRGWIAGYSLHADNASREATLWIDGVLVPLGTLGGPNSSVTWPVKNNAGLVVGISQTGAPDPLGEKWSCSAFFSGPDKTGYTCRGFAWEGGAIRALPTLGGNNGFATGANDAGLIVGWAENTVHDSTCVAPQVLQFHAVIWGPGHDEIRALPPLPGDTSGAATAINNSGQIVGISGTCDQAVGRFTAAHAVIWENGVPTDIGNLGGNTWNTPMAINEAGDVAGFAGQAGDDPDNPMLRAFFWSRDRGIVDLGTLAGDATSQATGINAAGQIVGTSCSASGSCRAFLWQNGVMVDLNTLVSPHGPTMLESAQDINDAGTITGRALNRRTGVRSAYQATPMEGR